MKDTEIITISNKKALKSECRRIDNEYYFIGDMSVENSGDCYFINGRYYKNNTGYIIYDHFIRSYAIKNKNFIYGIIKIIDKITPIFGYFSTDEKNNMNITVIINEQSYTCLNEDILKNTYYLENLQDGIFYERTSINSTYFLRKKCINSSLKYNLSYDSFGLMKDLIKNYNKLYSPIYNRIVKNNENITKDLSFGLEFETTDGFIPERICKKLGLMPLRDGSIKGLEYVTIPLSGKKGIQTIIDSLKELNRRTTYDKSCSIHLHIGNVPRTEEFIIALFKVLMLSQDEMFSMFPIYKKYNYGVKRKHYTKPFPLNETILLMDNVIDEKNIKKNFNILFRYLSMGYNYENYDNNLSNVEYHPSDPKGRSKWNIRTRYHAVNLIPLLFGNKQTIEFRLHTPTYDIDKIINFLCICSSLINYVKENTTKILTNFSSIKNMKLIDFVFNTTKDIKISNKITDYIYSYIKNRIRYIYEASSAGVINPDEDKFIFKNYSIWDDNRPPLINNTFLNSQLMNKSFDNFISFDTNYRVTRTRRNPVRNNDPFFNVEVAMHNRRNENIPEIPIEDPEGILNIVNETR